MTDVFKVRNNDSLLTVHCTLTTEHAHLAPPSKSESSLQQQVPTAAVKQSLQRRNGKLTGRTCTGFQLETGRCGSWTAAWKRNLSVPRQQRSASEPSSQATGGWPTGGRPMYIASLHSDIDAA